MAVQDKAEKISEQCFNAGIIPIIGRIGRLIDPEEGFKIDNLSLFYGDCESSQELRDLKTNLVSLITKAVKSVTEDRWTFEVKYFDETEKMMGLFKTYNQSLNGSENEIFWSFYKNYVRRLAA